MSELDFSVGALLDTFFEYFYVDNESFVCMHQSLVGVLL